MYFYAARQPILDANKELFAYELLFRDGVDNVFPDVDGDMATSRIIEGAQINFGLAELTDNKPAFINFTLETIAKHYPSMMTPESLVVEILETVQPGKRLLAEVQRLHEQGYTLALDDYEHKPVWKHFYPYINMIKLDLRSMSQEEMLVVINDLKAYPKIILLAEKVETLEEFEWAKSVGFTYFQGFFFSKPEMVKTKNLSPAQMTLAELLYETSNEDVNLPKITQVFERDINLSYKLLRYANSSTFRRVTEISTIKQAIIVLGHLELKKFISLIFSAQVNDSKPDELLKMSMVRARFCEQLAVSEKSQDVGMAFLTGMMSLIDAILDESIEKVMEQLPLANDIKTALINNEGKLAEFLKLAKTYERGDWEAEREVEHSLNIPNVNIPEIYASAINWADEQISVLHSID